MEKIYKINKLDNVAINMDQDSDIKYGHKVALEDIKKGQYIIKYGHIIGKASQDIKKGEWVPSHNLITHLDEENNYSYHHNKIENIKKKKTFLGYKRKNNRAGIRNDIYIAAREGDHLPLGYLWKGNEIVTVAEQSDGSVNLFQYHTIPSSQVKPSDDVHIGCAYDDSPVYYIERIESKNVDQTLLNGLYKEQTAQQGNSLLVYEADTAGKMNKGVLL